MWWYGRGNIGGSWLPEEKKTNMWHGRGNSSASWPPAFPRSSLTYFLFQFLSLTYSVYFSSLTHILCVGYYLFWSLSCVLVLMLDLFFVMLIVRHHRPNLCLGSCPLPIFCFSSCPWPIFCFSSCPWPILCFSPRL